MEELLKELHKSDKSDVYIKQIKVTVVHLEEDERSSYGIAADTNGAVHLALFGENSLVKEGHTILLHGAVLRNRLLIIRQSTKVFKTSEIKISEAVWNQAVAMVNEPRYEVTCNKDILALDPSNSDMRSAKGQVITVQDIRTVSVKGVDTKVREIAMDDGTGKLVIDLWSTATELDFQTGETVLFKDCSRRFSPYKKMNTISVSRKSQLLKCSATERILDIEIQGFNERGNNFEIMATVEDEVKIYVITKGMLTSALDIGMWNEENAQKAIPRQVHVVIKNNEVIDMV